MAQQGLEQYDRFRIEQLVKPVVNLYRISPQPGAPLKSGASVILFLEIEALAAGETVISFDPNAQAVTSDGRSVRLQMTESRLTVK